MSILDISNEILTELDNIEDDFDEMCESIKDEFYYENCKYNALSVKKYIHKVRGRLYSLEQLLNKVEKVDK